VVGSAVGRWPAGAGVLKVYVEFGWVFELGVAFAGRALSLFLGSVGARGYWLIVIRNVASICSVPLGGGAAAMCKAGGFGHGASGRG